MKHLLNNISEEEKNRIREQHEGGMNLSIDNFKTLVETKLGDAKPYLTEVSQEDELDEQLRLKYLTIPEIESLAKEIVGKLDDNLKKQLRRLDMRNDRQRMMLVNDILELVGINTDKMGGGPLG